MLERLHKILASAGIASRRACEQIIAEGRVRIDGEIVVEMGIKVDPQISAVTIDGKALPRPKLVYYLLNKPAGCLCTTEDQFGRKTVLDLMTGIRERIFPVGRLDEDTEGLLILTNDGALANVLTHPRYGVRKTYVARVKGRLAPEAMDALRSGIYLPGGRAVAEELVVRRYKTGDALVRMIVREGRNHVVKKMLAAVGNPVKKLKRMNIEFLTLHRLSRGAWRPLTAREVELLRELATKQTALATASNRSSEQTQKSQSETPKRRLIGPPKKRPGSRRALAAKKSPIRPRKPASRKPSARPAASKPWQSDEKREAAPKQTSAYTARPTDTKSPMRPKRPANRKPSARPAASKPWRTGEKRDAVAKRSSAYPARRGAAARKPAPKATARDEAAQPKSKNYNPRRTGERFNDTTRKSTTWKNNAGDGRSSGQRKRPAGSSARAHSKGHADNTGKRKPHQPQQLRNRRGPKG